MYVLYGCSSECTLHYGCMYHKIIFKAQARGLFRCLKLDRQYTVLTVLELYIVCAVVTCTCTCMYVLLLHVNYWKRLKEEHGEWCYLIEELSLGCR